MTGGGCGVISTQLRRYFATFLPYLSAGREKAAPGGAARSVWRQKAEVAYFFLMVPNEATAVGAFAVWEA